MTSEREELLERMNQLPVRLTRLVENKSDEALRRAGTGGGWGAVEHLAHLADFDEVSLERVDLIVNGSEPELEVFDTDLRAVELDYHDQNPRESLERFRAVRNRLVERLSGLDDAGWRATAHHPHFGQITLEDLVVRIDEHDRQHLRTLKEDLL